MADQRKLYREQFKIRSSGVDSTGNARLPALCDLLQETAGNHALRLNVDISQLKDQNLTWVLHRLQVRMDTYPSWRDEVEIVTWPSSGDRLRAYRDFELRNTEGELLGRALSYWLMMDIETRRPVRMPEHIIKLAPESIDHVLPLDTDRITLPDKLPVTKSFRVRRSDLDMNRHVNNVTYIEWLSESIPAERTIISLDVEFLAECRYGESITVQSTQEADNRQWHRIARPADSTLLARAQTEIA